MKSALQAWSCLFLLALFEGSPAWSGSYLGSSSESFQPFIVVHGPGYDGSGGQLTVGICVEPESATVIPAAVEAIQLWNRLTPTVGNCQGCVLHEEVDPKSPPTDDTYQLFLAVAHELGHCAMGLDHINWTNPNTAERTSFTTSKNTGIIVDGADDVRGSRDDMVPLPGTRVLHWYRRADNDPFALDGAVIDSETFSRGITSLPEGSTWPASGNRAVGEILGFPDSQSIMYTAIAAGTVFSGLSPDDVNTVQFARSGLDSQAGTADDYTMTLELVSACADADIEIEWVDEVVGGALGECFAFPTPIDSTSTSVHHGLIPFKGSERILVRINSSVRWDVAFADGFETGDVSRWE